MKDLQEKMDRHGPPDFDRMALWNKIERPEKRQKPFLLWWSLGVAALVIGLILTYNYSSSLKSPSDQFVQPTFSNKQQASKREATPNQPIPEVLTKKPILNADTKVATSNQSALTAVALSRTQQLKPDIFLNQDASTKIETPITTSLRALSEQEKTLNAIPSHPPIEVEYTAESRLENISILPSLAFHVIGANPPNLDAWHTPKPNKNLQRLNEFNISIGAVAHWYLDSIKTCQEKPTLPGYFLGISYKRLLPKGFYLLADFNYIFHQSSIRTSNVDTQLFYDSAVGNTIVKTTTFYEFYNQYHRLDFGIGIGHTWSLSGFDVSLDAGLGAAHWFKIDGDYWNAETGFQPFPESTAVQTNLYGSLSGRFSRTWANGNSLGLIIVGKTPITLSPSGDDCAHRVLPINLGVSLGKQF